MLPIVYDALRRLAAQRIAEERPGQTLQPTALVHEAYLRIVGAKGERRWESQAKFFAAAADAMRRILIDAARKKQAVKRGGDAVRVQFDEALAGATGEAVESDDLLALDRALSKLEMEAPDKARLVKLRFFAGLSIEEAADALQISRATAARHWEYARTWLRCEMNHAGE